jgi:hypothetical protein
MSSNMHSISKILPPLNKNPEGTMEEEYPKELL